MMRFWEGRMTLKGKQCNATAVLNLLLQHSIPYLTFGNCGECFSLTMTYRAAHRLLCLCEAEGVELDVVSGIGLPDLWRRYGKRVGLAIGSLLAVLLLFLSSRIVWDVRITGNVRIGEGEICAMLEENGLGIGTYIPSLDTDLVESRLLLSHREISWVSVNIRGTSANVEILETERGLDTDTAAANLVASRDGLIERIEAYDGNVCVKVGDAVKAGDVLASGIYEGGDGSLRTTRADGRIFARTMRHFEVEIPMVTTQKVYTGRSWNEKSIKFFTNRIKVFANTGNEGATCDIIYYDRMLTLPGGTVIPIGMETVRHLEYREEPITLRSEEAMDRAFAELEMQLGVFVSETGAELLRKIITCDPGEQAFRLICTVVCIEDIARVEEIDIN